MILRPPRSTRTDTLFPYTTLFRSDPPDHGSRTFEVVLVVRPLRGAVSDDEGGLPRSAGAARALGVVRRRRRHVAHVDRVQRRDVDTELHRRRAEHRRQRDLGLAHLTHVLARFGQLRAVLFLPAEAAFAPFAPRLVDLSGMLATFEPE